MWSSTKYELTAPRVEMLDPVGQIGGDRLYDVVHERTSYVCIAGQPPAQTAFTATAVTRTHVG